MRCLARHAGMVLGGAVRGGTKALQRLTAQERLQDLRVASQHLEATASGGIPPFLSRLGMAACT